MKMIWCVAAALALMQQQAVAEIYKYVNPATGAVEYTNQPKRGGVRMNASDTLAEIGIKGRGESPAYRAQIAQQKKAQGELQKLFPECAPGTCQPAPGMPIALAKTAFPLSYDGFSHTSSGRSERYKYGRCLVHVSAATISAVYC